MRQSGKLRPKGNRPVQTDTFNAEHFVRATNTGSGQQYTEIPIEKAFRNRSRHTRRREPGGTEIGQVPEMEAALQPIRRSAWRVW